MIRRRRRPSARLVSENSSSTAEVSPSVKPSSRRMAPRLVSESASSTAEAKPALKPSSRRLALRKSSRLNSKPDEKASKRSTASSGGGLSTGQMMGLGVGACVLLLIVGMALSSGRDKEKAVAPKKTEALAVDEGETTPSSQLARLAEQNLASGNKSTALNYYARAANKAEKEGYSYQARVYSMKAKDLMASSKLYDH